MRLSRIEQHPATLKRNETKTHIFVRRSLSFSLSFFCGGKKEPKNRVSKKAAVLITERKSAFSKSFAQKKRPTTAGYDVVKRRRCSFCACTLFFRCSRADHFDPRRFVRANIENDYDDDDADVSLATRFSLRSFYPNDDFGDERRRRRGRGLPRKNASAETTTTKKKKKPTAPYFWSAQSLSVARETRTIRKRPT